MATSHKCVSDYSEVPEGYISVMKIRSVLGEQDATRAKNMAAAGDIKCVMVDIAGTQRGPIFVDPNSIKHMSRETTLAFRERLIAVKLGLPVTDKMREEATISLRHKKFPAAPKKEETTLANDAFIDALEVGEKDTSVPPVVDVPEPVVEVAVETASDQESRAERMVRAFEKNSELQEKTIQLQQKTIIAINKAVEVMQYLMMKCD